MTRSHMHSSKYHLGGTCITRLRL